MMMVLSLIPFASQGIEADTTSHLVINQVYGGGGKGSTPISNSFIELYNPLNENIDLNGYRLDYNGSAQLDLSGTIPAQGSFLILGNAETTDATYLTYELPQADMSWNLTISNKNYTLSLIKDDETVDTVTADESVAAVKISKQKSLMRINHQDTDTNDDFRIVVWEKTETIVDRAFVDLYAPHNSNGENGAPYDEISEPQYTPVKTGSSRVPGFFNDTSDLITELAGRYNAGAMNADGGSMEIVAYNSKNGFAYAVNGLKGTLALVNLNGSLEGETVTELPAMEISVKALIEKEGFTYGDMTSAAVSPDGSKVAVAIQDEDYAKSGAAAVFTADEDGTLRDPQVYATGVQPDMIVFAGNNTILTADEGEPRNGIGNGVQDPAGSVSVIDLKEQTSVQVGFEGFTAEELTAQNILIGQKDGVCFDPVLDLEPEYIAVSADSKNAYISLQEANAIAVLDIETKTIAAICSAGFQDYGEVAVDLTEDGEYNADTYTGLLGARMPDGIALYEAAGKTYLLTANEGDAREWGSEETEFLNESKKKAFTSDTKGLETKIKLIDASVCAGLPEGKDVMFGGRSFTVFEVTENGLTEVFDSGSDFETVTAEVLPEMFNISNDDTNIDSRSPKKGPEPESVTVGTVGNRTYAFIALERIGGIMIYDITDASNSQFVNYINSREFDNVIQGDTAPEGLAFINAENTADGKALLLAACEVSGTLAAYTMEPAEKDLPFTDVEKEDWFYEDIAFVYANGLMNGMDSTVFAPDTATTRGMFVTVLYRLEGTPKTEAQSTFSDVPAEAYFHDAVVWAAENSIVNGYGNGHFGPNDAVTREQAATILYRYAQYKGYDVTLSENSVLSSFADTEEISDYALPAMEWTCGNGLMQGYAGNLNPAGNTTRAQTAALFHRFIEEIAE